VPLPSCSGKRGHPPEVLGLPPLWRRDWAAQGERSAVPGWRSQLEKLFYPINSYGVLRAHRVPQLLPCRRPASSGSAGPTDFPGTRFSGSPSGDGAKIQDRAPLESEKKKPQPSPSRAVNGGTGIPDVSFPQQGSSDFLLAHPARYFWILAAGTQGTPCGARAPGKPTCRLCPSSPTRAAASSARQALAGDSFKGLKS